MTQHLSDELLQRHHDGDLSSSEDAEARAHLERCSECRAQLASYRRLGEFVQLAIHSAHSAHYVDDVDAADAHDANNVARDVDFEAVLARIERAAAEPAGSALRAVPIAPASAPAKIRRIRPMAPALGALAIAAAALLMVFRESPTGDEAGEDPQALLASGSEIVEIDFGSNAGTVFDIALEDGSSVPVVWINDEDE